MSLLPKCSSCKREGGYAESGSDKICARCKVAMLASRNRNEKESGGPSRGK